VSVQVDLLFKTNFASKQAVVGPTVMTTDWDSVPADQDSTRPLADPASPVLPVLLLVPEMPKEPVFVMPA
jgi:hypothetical protein